MLNSTSIEIEALGPAAKLIVLVIRLTATVGFVIAPASLGFVVIGIAEQLISWAVITQPRNSLHVKRVDLALDR
jgi:hypothetical protein